MGYSRTYRMTRNLCCRYFLLLGTYSNITEYMGVANLEGCTQVMHWENIKFIIFYNCIDCEMDTLGF